MTQIAYDVTRLFLGPLSRTPRGIDRIELILARHFFGTAPHTTFGVLPTPWGMRVYDSRRVLRAVDRLEQLWAEHSGAVDDPALVWLKARLLGQKVGPPPFRSKPGPAEKGLRMLRLIAASGFSFGRRATRVLPEGCAYLNVGQLSLAVPVLFRWLDRRPDIWAAFMLHDVIPLQEPGLVAPLSVRFHDRMVATTARHADGLIVTTQAAKGAVWNALADKGCRDIPTVSAMLPLHAGFDSPSAADPALAGQDYFVVCGAIEPRKNLLLLLAVWCELVRQLGPETPHLVVVGTPNYQGDSILAQFAGSTETLPYIHVVSGLSTPSLKVVISGARALLMPSLAEGYGLPIVEAEALGCPVIASDIAAHREVAGHGATLLDPQDAAVWVRAVLAAKVADRRPERRAAADLATDRRVFVEQIAGFLRERGRKGGV